MIEILQGLPQSRDASLVAAGHSGAVSNRIGQSAGQYRRIVNVAFLVARVLHIGRTLEYQRAEDIRDAEHDDAHRGIHLAVNRLVER